MTQTLVHLARLFLPAGMLVGLAMGAAAQEAERHGLTAGQPLEGPSTSRGVTFEPMAALALGEEVAGLDGLVMRASILTIAPDGVLAVHSHLTRPAFSWVLDGRPLEIRSNQPDPIQHGPGSITRETAMSHFWRNDTGQNARLLVVDLVRPGGSIGVELDRPDRRPEGPAPDAPAAPVGATVAVQGEIDLGLVYPEMAAAQGRILRARRIDLVPGAHSHLHRHENAPSFTYVAKGRVREHRNDQPTANHYGQGEVAIDRAGMAHWWEVVGDEPVVFRVAEIIER